MKTAVSTRLLVIDDDNLVRAALTDMLQTAGFEVVTASNGRLGLELLETTPVDAIITDILMPEQEGLETIREARQRFPDIRILAISGGGAGGGETQLSGLPNLSAPIRPCRSRSRAASSWRPSARYRRAGFSARRNG